MKRKGAKRINEIPASILEKLNKGEIETANLMEWLAIDQKKLLSTFLKEIGRIDYLKAVENKIASLKHLTSNTISLTIGMELCRLQYLNNDKELVKLLIQNKSDTVRGWAAYCIGKDPHVTLNKMLKKMQPLAADPHYCVRELAWMAARPAIANNLNEGIKILINWSQSKDANIRRFSSEVTRPRGVWCNHITSLKENPEQGVSILNNLMSDRSKYVRDSVGNWLNDASKSRPDFVIAFCNKWKETSSTKETEYIIKKALRTINKTND